MTRTRRRPGEFELIARHFAPLASDPAALGLSDDAALIRPREGEDLVVTTDLVAAGVHFFADDPPASIARKALRVNLSDLAAKGYDLLDKSVVNLVENGGPVKSQTDQWLISMLIKSEFKRWQAPPVLKVTKRAFGRGRRFPIAHQAKEI